MLSVQVSIVPVLIGIVCVILIFIYYYLKQRNVPRFRKRDKVMFYGRKWMRRFKTSLEGSKRRYYRIKKRQILLRSSKQPLQLRLINLLEDRVRGNLHDDTLESPQRRISVVAHGSLRANFSKVAILTDSDEVPLSSFCRELSHGLTANVSIKVKLLSSRTIIQTLGADAFDEANESKLTEYLNDQQKQHTAVLYQCDSSLTPWTLHCLRRSDCALTICNYDGETGVGELEKRLDKEHPMMRKELVILHREECSKCPPIGTREKYLVQRPWCVFHHHIRAPARVFIQDETRSEQMYQSLDANAITIDNDFARLARYLAHKSIGLVLGGGGARGAAHVGILKALREANVPIDMVGGVSIGALMGALWCQENNIDRVKEKARVWAFTLTSLWRQILDLTYPVTAMFTGAAFNRSIHNIFGDHHIEDLWLPYFTVTTDITSSSPRIHLQGSLWRYVRSSMSLSGYLPPLCDPEDGHLLLDGGYVNNLPADVMHEVMGANTILAVDVGSQDDESELLNYGDTLSGWWILWNRWNPFGRAVRVPDVPEIQSRLAYVCCVRQLEQVKRSDYCHYIRPPIDKYETFQFSAFDEIFNVGYKHGVELFSKEKRRKRNWITQSNQDQDS